MLKSIILSTFLILPALVLSQNFTLPSVVVDSMIFEVRKGRACDSLQKAQLRLILATQEQLSSRDKVIALQDRQIENYGLIQETWEKRFTNAQELYTIEKSSLRQKVKKRNKLIVGQSLVIAILVAVILGG